MSAAGWAALALAVLVLPGVAGWPARFDGLTSAARLAAAGPGRTAARRSSPRWAHRWWAPGWADRWADGWTDRWADGWTDGWAQRSCVLGGSVVVGSALARYGPAIGAAAAAGVGLAAVLVRDAVAGRAGRTRRTDLAAAVRLLVAELEAGARAPDALAAAAEAGRAHRAVFSQAAQHAAAGSEPAQALLADPDTRPTAIAWRLAQDSGAAPAAVLARVAADLDAAHEQDRAVAVALAGARSSAAVLTGLPLLGAAMGLAMGAHPVAFLLDAPAGRLVCCAGVLLDVAGVLWVRRIVRSAART